MAFFEDIGKKMSQTGQDALKKTKTLAEITKLGLQIDGEKKLIGESYAKIGEEYYKLFGGSPDESLAGFVTDIKASEARIGELEEQIKKLKGLSTCPACGASVPAGAKFCVTCGAKIEVPAEETEEAAPEPRLCAVCSQPIPDGAVFCASCGAKVE